MAVIVSERISEALRERARFEAVMVTRRKFLCGTAAAAATAAEAAPSAAPFRVLYSNDTTNTMGVLSPYHKKGEPWNPAMLKASVDEADGVDVHLLQPGLCWIPWWKSSVYPAAEHYRWFSETTGLPIDAVGKYLSSGGDIVQVFIGRCRQRGQSPFISFRLNDAHHLEAVGTRTAQAVNISKFYFEHPEYRLGKNLNKPDEAVQNWAIPEVRSHKFSFIRELCEGYDLDGLELDFLRFWALFNQQETTVKQRRSIVTDFVADVRKLLDGTARNPKRRWLCARVPSAVAGFGPLGIDLPAMMDAGLDMVNVSTSYFTNQQTDLPEIRRQAPKARIYLEMTHSTYNGPNRAKYDNFPFLRTCDEQFYTGAHLAYAQGADGVSLFNFVYFRQHGGPGRGDFTEPPFHILKHLGDRTYVAREPQWYVLAKLTQPPLPDRQMPRKTIPREPQIFELQLAPNHGSQRGLLRIRWAEEASRDWSVKFNGESIESIAYVAEPLANPYRANLEIGGTFSCFGFSRDLVRTGTNQIEVTMRSGEPVTIDYLDLVLP
jgi:hypothetical protein